MTRTRRRWMPLPLIALLLAAGGCSLFPESTPLQVLDPDPEAPAAAAESMSGSLDVELPDADPMRAGERVLVRTADGRLTLHPSARWVAPPPQLLRLLVVRGLRDAALLDEVGASQVGADRQLRFDLRAFELVEQGPNLNAVIEIEARLVRRRTSELVARRLFSQRLAIESIDAAEVVAAFDELLGEWIADLAFWLRQSADPASDEPEPVR